MTQVKALKDKGFLLFLVAVIAGFSSAVSADEASFDATPDYIKDCKYATCVGLAAMEWSEKHPFGVAISVRMGTSPAVTADQIKMVLTQDFKHYGVKNLRFFYEQNDVPASVIKLHVRGGTEGPFVISNVRQEIETVALRAKNKNPALVTNQ